MDCSLVCILLPQTMKFFKTRIRDLGEKEATRAYACEVGRILRLPLSDSPPLDNLLPFECGWNLI